MPQPDATAELQTALEERILVLDGAMGTTIREYGIKEEAARGERFAYNKKDLLNNGDILSITQPDVITDIHGRFPVRSDIIETNSFSGTAIAQSEFFVEDPRETGKGIKDQAFYQDVIDNPFLVDLAHEINFKSAQLARQACDAYTKLTGRKRYAAGAIGPMTVGLTTQRSTPMILAFVRSTLTRFASTTKASPLPHRGRRGHSMVETIFDGLNAKCASWRYKTYSTRPDQSAHRHFYCRW